MIILFTCKGNICRSPMAEFMLKSLRPDLRHRIFSAALTRNTLGMRVHRGVIKQLKSKGMQIDPFREVVLKEEYNGIPYVEYDLTHLHDPFYDEDFDKTYHQILDFLITEGFLEQQSIT